MTVAIDLRVLDGPSGWRGIGVYARTITHEILPDILNGRQHRVYLLVYSKKDVSFLPTPLRRACRIIVVPKRLGWVTKRFRAKLASIIERLDYLPRSTRRQLDGVDRFFQISNEYGLPRLGTKTKTLIMAHDLAPLKIPEGFFDTKLTWKPYSWLRFVYKKRQQHVYKHRLKHFFKADIVLANSHFTRRSLIRELKMSGSKIIATPLAVAPMPKPQLPSDHYKTHPYLFFIGGLDGRRDMDSLFAAMRLITAKNSRIKLLLAGKDFEYADNLVPPDLKEQVKLLGYISEQQKADYLAAALAFVYPTLYEGFGLPILEAFSVDCPVITYRNSSLGEIGGEAALYVSNAKQIAEQALRLNRATVRKKAVDAGRVQLEKFSWQSTAEKTLTALDLDL